MIKEAKESKESKHNIHDGCFFGQDFYEELDVSEFCDEIAQNNVSVGDGNSLDKAWGSPDDIRYMVQESLEAFWQIDQDLKITFANAACEKMSGGFTKEEFVGKSLFEFLMPEGIENLWRINDARLKDEARGMKTDILFHEIRLKRKNGNYFWAGISSRPIRDAEGKLIGYQGIIRDISAYKQQEAERKKLEILLNKTQKMAAIGQLTGRAIHELNNVLGSIMGYSELLMVEDELDRETVFMNATNIVNSGEKATAILQDLLIVTAKDGEERRDVDLNELIGKSLKQESVQKMLEHYSGLVIQEDLEPSLKAVRLAAPQVDRIFVNLVVLACEKAGPGGVVDISTRTVYLGRPIQGYENLREGEYVVVSITDNGDGIAEKDIGHVFEPFYIHKVLKKGISGLELFVAREVIRDHNGFIDVMSEPGFGATFTVYLPVAYGDVQSAYRMMPEAGYSVRPSSIN